MTRRNGRRSRFLDGLDYTPSPSRACVHDAAGRRPPRPRYRIASGRCLASAEREGTFRRAAGLKSARRPVPAPCAPGRSEQPVTGAPARRRHSHPVPRSFRNRCPACARGPMELP
ncbi:Hypothetical protein I596_2946 [Dokdonella koreensis DS-123]|uniref:Uncharacterized protein n=1 Tax=Dokdonella koreensis DS-123 TaxID=1300342 RepID=A0A160DWE2_9GAMM|nr:Hypothetical protein I596_2946 [Dokdonella koreensis DS-123]